MMNKILPRLELYTDFATYNLAGDDEEAVAAAIAHIEDAGVTAFLAAVPGYHPSRTNAERLVGWCTSRGIPMTCWNLVLAHRALMEDGQLGIAPPPEQPSVDKWASVTLTRTDILAEYQPSDAEAAALAKVVDDSNLNDHQRKARDRKLALLAGQQRREFALQSLR
jgi:hypothetical protein